MDDVEYEPPAWVNDARDAVAQGFRPHAPVTNRDLFAGRLDQLSQLLEAASQPGLHAAVYGERGVGKTSLASIASKVLSVGPGLAVRVNCSSGDSFDSVWRRVFDDMGIVAAKPGLGFVKASEKEAVSADALLGSATATAGLVHRALRTLSNSGLQVTVFLDEFDRLDLSGSKSQMADLMKSLADQDTSATIVLVGVADDVDELISEHRSIERGLVQIAMPRMSRQELGEIVSRGVSAADMSITASARDTISSLSQGLPHYTHLITQNAAYCALDEEQQQIDDVHVKAAIHNALARAQQSVLSAYTEATSSNRKDTLYKQVLLGCALAKTDAQGTFAASDVRAPLERIMGRPYEIAAFAQHLSSFSGGDPNRAAVLQKRGKERRYRYRFINPLLQPYIVMKGIEDGLFADLDEIVNIPI